MKQFHVLRLVIFISLTTASAEAFNYALAGCKDMCGEVRIPYPFGIGANCALNEWYAVDCNSSTPYLHALDNIEVLGVRLENQTVTVNVSTIIDCRSPVRNSIDLGGSPFLFSPSNNIFVVEGCGNAVILENGRALTGCSTTCHNDTVSERYNCLGNSCCQTEIPNYLKSYSMNLTRLERRGGDRACVSAFLLDKNSHVARRFSSQFVVGQISFVPISLQWTLTPIDFKVNEEYCHNITFSLGNGTCMKTGKCDCMGRGEGNPYLSNGCRDSEKCIKCKRTGGICVYGEPSACGLMTSSQNIICISPDTNSGSKSSSRGVILGVSISMGLLFLMSISYAFYTIIQKTKAKRQKEKFFKRNGGLLLKQQETADTGVGDETILFTSNELKKATDQFNENRILGRGGQGTVYKGMLTDGRIVAVKKSKVVDESQLEHFINEVVILSQVNHRNVVKLLGCCLETEVPLLVSEFISNGTLYDLIQDDTCEFPISLNMRLQIAVEVAGALSYLHSETSIPIYHRDIKTTNILLDEKYRAKVSDFGTSRFVSVDQTHLTTLVKGTFGYLDPEYFQSSQFTEKSDVYSFGVVLVELLTREKPISLTRFGENRSLATHFMLAMEEGRVMSIFDAMVIKEDSRGELMAVANLAMRCLNLNGRNRPTMKEVAIELEGIRMSHVPFLVQTNYGQEKYGEELSMLTYGESTTTMMSFDDDINE